jgi:hypothetical protein
MLANEREHRSPADQVFHELHRRFVVAHDELRDRMTELLVAANGDRLSRRVDEYTDRLLRHHRAEDEFVFPAFRAAGRLRSSDVAFLDARDAEHRDVHRLCVELRSIGFVAIGGDQKLLRLGRELEAMTRPHYELEESVLTVAHLKTLMTEREVLALFEDIPARWNSG